MDGAARLLDGEREIAVARAAAVALDPPAAPPAAALEAACEEYLAHRPTMVFPECFVCGAARTAGDGLRVFAGAVPDAGVNAARWRPTEDLADNDGRVAPEFLWAALDCPSYFALRKPGLTALLGRMAADLRSRPEPGEALTVLAWPLGADGRKHHAASAIYRASGELAALARATWIELRVSA
jgi:hypothetical protein